MLERFTLDQARVLVTVAETGSFSAAGRRLRRVQSAISQSAQSLETALGIALFDRSGKTPTLTDAGRILLEDARRLVQGAETLRARAESIAADIEPELTLAVDAMFPGPVLMASLKAMSEAFPGLPVTLFTEGLGAPEQRLSDGVARLAIYATRPPAILDVETEFLTSILMIPVVAATHPLVRETGPLNRDRLEPYVQLVLTDRTSFTARFSGGILGRRIWRFADLANRLDYLLGGFGWCNMPIHLVEDHIAAGRLKRLDIKEYGRQPFAIPLSIVHERGRPPRRAGKWLISDLRKRLLG